MTDLFFIAFGAGLQDGLNPCIFMTSAVFIALGPWIKKKYFVLVYALSTLFFNFGSGQIFVFQKNFVFAAKVIYFILGVWAFILGVLFLKDWFLMRRGLPASVMARGSDDTSRGRSNLFGVLTVVLAIALSALSTLWPINNYIMLLGNEALLRGQGTRVMPLLAGYIFFSMWALWFVWVFLSIKNLKPSLLRIFCASIFFTASSCMIFIFR